MRRVTWRLLVGMGIRVETHCGEATCDDSRTSELRMATEIMSKRVMAWAATRQRLHLGIQRGPNTSTSAGGHSGVMTSTVRSNVFFECIQGFGHIDKSAPPKPPCNFNQQQSGLDVFQNPRHRHPPPPPHNQNTRTSQPLRTLIGFVHVLCDDRSSNLSFPLQRP